MLVKSLFLCPSKRWRSSDLENKIPRSSDVYMVPKNVSVAKQEEAKECVSLSPHQHNTMSEVSRHILASGCCHSSFLNLIWKTDGTFLLFTFFTDFWPENKLLFTDAKCVTENQHLGTTNTPFGVDPTTPSDRRAAWSSHTCQLKPWRTCFMDTSFCVCVCVCYTLIPRYVCQLLPCKLNLLPPSQQKIKPLSPSCCPYLSQQYKSPRSCTTQTGAPGEGRAIMRRRNRYEQEWKAERGRKQDEGGREGGKEKARERKEQRRSDWTRKYKLLLGVMEWFVSSGKNLWNQSGLYWPAFPLRPKGAERARNSVTLSSQHIFECMSSMFFQRRCVYFRYLRGCPHAWRACLHLRPGWSRTSDKHMEGVREGTLKKHTRKCDYWFHLCHKAYLIAVRESVCLCCQQDEVWKCDRSWRRRYALKKKKKKEMSPVMFFQPKLTSITPNH